MASITYMIVVTYTYLNGVIVEGGGGRFISTQQTIKKILLSIKIAYVSKFQPSFN